MNEAEIQEIIGEFQEHYSRYYSCRKHGITRVEYREIVQKYLNGIEL